MKKILVAGIGNIFFGDDAFGVEVAHELLKRPQPPEVQVIDFGIRTYDLAYALTGHHDGVILVDATSRGREPGTLYLIEPDLEQLAQVKGSPVDPHNLDLVYVLQMAEALGGMPKPPYLVGCEPSQLELPDGQMGLSQPVREAVPKAVEMIESLVRSLSSLETTKASGFVPVLKET